MALGERGDRVCSEAGRRRDARSLFLVRVTGEFVVPFRGVAGVRLEAMRELMRQRP